MKNIKITLTIPAFATVEKTTDNKPCVVVKMDMSNTAKFYRKLRKLCDKYGYDISQIDGPDKEV